MRAGRACSPEKKGVFGEGAECESPRRPLPENLARRSVFVQSNGMKIIYFALISFPICLLADNGLPNQPYIYIEGKAEVEKPADMVKLRFDVYGHDADRAKAN